MRLCKAEIESRLRTFDALDVSRGFRNFHFAGERLADLDYTAHTVRHKLQTIAATLNASDDLVICSTKTLCATSQ